MNELEELAKVDVKALPALPSHLLDDLHQKVLKNLHLELGSGPILYMLSPSYSVLNPRASEAVGDLIAKIGPILDFLKEAIVQNLAAYSVLLDVNSYFIEQNSHLVLARLRERDSGGRRFEIKFYTHAPMELLSHYEDKIYIGRDFLDLFAFPRKYFGLRDLLASLKAKAGTLIENAQPKLKSPLEYASFLQEIQESVNELESESAFILDSLPPQIDFKKIGGKELIEINAQYRTINHYLIELNDELGEFENLLRYKQETDFVRYVTKYKKDVTNLISYINIKVNGLLAHKIQAHKSRSG
ncbi:MAG: hypothetical protein JW747_00265 [Candidatus Aminicenantes bacterium]|nr:hypothetical protein [Candidatus Aminicenantes bacterium]